MPLLGRNVHAETFTVSNGNVLINREGLYYAAITADIPEETAVDTILHLELDDQVLNPPRIALSTDTDRETTNYAGHTVFYAREGSLLQLICAKPFCITDTTAQSVFTVTLVKL